MNLAIKARWLVGAVTISLGTAACVGEITSPDSRSESPSDPSGSGGSSYTACQGKICVAAMHLSRLTRSQYENTVHQLLGDAVVVSTDYLPQDQRAAGIFKTTESVPMSDPDVDAYATVAEELAAAAPIAELVPCSPSAGDESCATDFIDAFVPRAYRRSVTPEERADYVALYQWAIDGGDSFEDGIRLVIATALQSPHFLNRMETGGVGSPRKLSGRELAVRLSYFLWREAPGPELVAAAEAGELDSLEGIESWARQMIAAPRFDGTIREFVRDWLGIGEVANAAVDAERFPDFTPELGASMLEETERFAVDVFRQGDGRQKTLLAADYSFVDARLAAHYGIPAPAASGFARAEIPGRAGLLTHASVLTTASSGTYTTPIFRGIFVRKRLLCQQLKPRPDNVGDLIAKLEPTLGANLTDRQRLTALTGNEPCSSCHGLTNPVGFAFDAFDGIGHSRKVDYTGAPIKTDSALDGGGAPEYSTDADGEYTGSLALTRALAESDDVAKCVSLQWLRYSLGYDAVGDESSQLAAHQLYAGADYDLRELVIGVVRSDAFRHRVVPPVE